MCHIVAQPYAGKYNVIYVEIQCINKAFKGYQPLWSPGYKPIVKLLDFSALGY